MHVGQVLIMDPRSLHGYRWPNGPPSTARPGPKWHGGPPCRATSSHRAQLAAQAPPYGILAVSCQARQPAVAEVVVAERRPEGRDGVKPRWRGGGSRRSAPLWCHCATRQLVGAEPRR
jgi:hypothetical protein